MRRLRTVRGRTDHVVVVGAGLGGLSAAMRLAGAGRQVTVLEREAGPGGRAGQRVLAAPDGAGDYRFDTGPTVLTMPDLIADCFELARDIRTLDMRASPYDLMTIGLDPVHVETPDGRAEYVRFQRDFAERAGTLRRRLIDYCEWALGEPGTTVAATDADGRRSNRF